MAFAVLTSRDLTKVQQVAWGARSQWYNIGLNLGIDSDTLDEIKGNNREIKDCFRAMLATWLKSVNPAPTLRALSDALRSPTVGYSQLAQDLPTLYNNS